MRLSISNIAWERAEDAEVARLLRHLHVDAIDVAPGRYFDAGTPPPLEEVLAVRRWWADQGIEIVGMQALLFGTNGLNVFGPVFVREAMLAHLDRVCSIAAGLGCARLVFGSPKNRDRSAATDVEVEAVAAPFFRRLGDVAARHGVFICVEPNPPRYGANFLTTSAEAAEFVRHVGHPHIRMQLDTGAVTLSDEAPDAVVMKCRDLIGHIHASEPDLVPLGEGACNHSAFADALRAHLEPSIVTIEMLVTEDELRLPCIERAVRVAIDHYRPERRLVRTNG